MKYRVKFKSKQDGQWIDIQIEQDKPYVDLRCGMDGLYRMLLYSERDRCWFWEPVKEVVVERIEEQ